MSSLRPGDPPRQDPPRQDPPRQHLARGPGAIPGPSARHRLLGHQPEYVADPLGTFQRWSTEYGDAVRLRFGPVRVLLLTSPEAVEDVLVRRADAFQKAPVIRRAARSAIGDAVFAAEGEAWARQRALFEPFFSPERMAAHVPTIVTEVTETLSRWRPGATIETLADTMRLSQRIGGRVIFGAVVGEEDVERVADALAVTDADFQARIDSLALYLQPDWLPTPRAFRRRRAVATLHELVDGLIAARRRRARPEPDLLGELLQRQPDLPWLTDRLLRDDLVTLLVDSRENPGILLTWALYLLARDPEVAATAAAEVDGVLGARAPTAADIQRLPRVADVLLETLRLCPPVYGTGRQAVRDCTVAGIEVPRGTVILLSLSVMHRDAGRFPDPDTFRPDRWREPPIEPVPPGAFVPFGLGARRCLGEHLAWTIGVLGLAMLLREYRFTPADPRPVPPTIRLSQRPSREVLLLVEPRR